ncbi:MAG: hypothetical protein AB7I38_19515 [Dehalococcoidia bacterium]
MGELPLHIGAPVEALTGYSPRLDALLRMLPVFGQAAQVVPARSESTHLGLVRWGFGLPVSPYDRVSGAYFADRQRG